MEVKRKPVETQEELVNEARNTIGLLGNLAEHPRMLTDIELNAIRMALYIMQCHLDECYAKIREEQKNGS